MTVLLDTSILIDVFRDSVGDVASTIQSIVGEDEIALTRFAQMELLQGAANEKDWVLLASYLQDQDYLESSAATWQESAKIYYDLRRRGRTVRSSIDCCIAQIAIEHRVMLLHNDRDFETIAELRPLF